MKDYKTREKTDWVDGTLATLCAGVLIYITILIGSVI